MEKTSKGMRLHIGIFGRRNVGKSSILNALVGQEAAIVSDIAGTTTDPVEKPMELLPLGPVLFVDTAGVDDIGALGEKRISKTRKVFERTDLAMVVTEAGAWGTFEDEILKALEELKVPAIIVINKNDIRAADDIKTKYATISVSAKTGAGIDLLRELLIKQAPEEFMANPAILGDLVGPGKIAVLVVPIDKEAPKGRLILPQVQAIRDLLDSDAIAVVCKERELQATLEKLTEKPALVVTDSQAFLKVAADTPDDIPMTSFSILFARFKADLAEMAAGARAIDTLKDGDCVLIAESCTHHPITDDIGTVKIPRWLGQYVGGQLKFEWTRGHDLPEDLSKYKMIVHCGACMWNRREMLSRIMLAKKAGVPISNYGLVIAYSLGIFERALKPFGLIID
ncbi:MAG: [FeFe] hydrogenase H-cluster maturation GTPase HydF [Planctomycetes bacterium GWF2_50_10]|nr:MAG: [FeFe] hydrogenase H-cluster maturation GTPase HydF [Planctomycetes bacterium GWF2_50_10]